MWTGGMDLGLLRCRHKDKSRKVRLRDGVSVGSSPGLECRRGDGGSRGVCSTTDVVPTLLPNCYRRPPSRGGAGPLNSRPVGVVGAGPAGTRLRRGDGLLVCRRTHSGWVPIVPSEGTWGGVAVKDGRGVNSDESRPGWDSCKT